MPKKKRGEEAAEVPANITRSANFASHYANSTGIYGTKYDLSFLFGRITSDLTGQKGGIDQFAQVTISWQHARAMLEILKTQISKYEEVNGPIRLEGPGAEQPSRKD